VVGKITGGNGTFSVRLSPDGRQLYASNWYGGDVMVCDALNGSVLSRIQVNRWIANSERSISNLIVSPDGKTVYVANAFDNTVVLINPNASAIYKTIAVGKYPREMVLSPDGSQLFVSLIDDFSMCSISLPSGNITYQNMYPITPLGWAYSGRDSPLPTPAPAANATVTPAPTYAPPLTVTPAPMGQQPTPTVVPTVAPTPIYRPNPIVYKPYVAPTIGPETSSRPYFTGWIVPEINITREQMILGGFILVALIGILGVIGYLSVMRQMRLPEEEGDEYEDEDQDEDEDIDKPRFLRLTRKRK
jgi:YVTN family beta-propeller protein